MKEGLSEVVHTVVRQQYLRGACRKAGFGVDEGQWPREWPVFEAMACREDIPLPLKKPVQSRTGAALMSAARPHSKATHVARLDHELGIISTMGYAGYFLIVQDFTRAARELAVAAAHHVVCLNPSTNHPRSLRRGMFARRRRLSRRTYWSGACSLRPRSCAIPHAQQRRPLLSDIGPFGFLGVESVFYIVSCRANIG